MLNHSLLESPDAFSPLGLVHLALDKLGKGAPCGIAAFFPYQSEEQLAAAIQRHVRQLPLIHRRIDLSGVRPKMMPSEGYSAFVRVSGKSLEELLEFSISRTHGGTGWYVLQPSSEGCWLFAIWAHAIADGHSMLRFISRLAPSTSEQAESAHTERPPAALGRFFPWMVRTAINEMKPRLTFKTLSQPQCSVTWINAPSHTAQSLKAMARRLGTGVTGLLCGALVQALYKSSITDTSGRLQFVVPISRKPCSEVNGFGFGIGWLMPELQVTPASELKSMARSVHAQIRGMSAAGWDKNLERALGTDFSRVSRKVARMLERDGTAVASVSWKGWIPFVGTATTGLQIACFAAVKPNTSLCHLSGHIDQSGLSLSLSSCMPRGTAQHLFKSLLACLEIDSASYHQQWRLRVPDSAN
jgi:hypothetical protein